MTLYCSEQTLWIRSVTLLCQLLLLLCLNVKRKILPKGVQTLAAGLSLPAAFLSYWGCQGEENDRLSMTFCCRLVLFSNPAANPLCLVPLPCLLPPRSIIWVNRQSGLTFWTFFFSKAFRKIITHPVFSLVRFGPHASQLDVLCCCWAYL